MFSNFLQFAFDLVVLAVMAVGVVMSIPPIASWLHSKRCLELTPCKAKLGSAVIVAVGVFLMGNAHVLDGWSLLVACVCFVGFGCYGVQNLHAWKVWENWHWSDDLNQPPTPPTGGCGS